MCKLAVALGIFPQPLWTFPPSPFDSRHCIDSAIGSDFPYSRHPLPPVIAHRVEVFKHIQVIPEYRNSRRRPGTGGSQNGRDFLVGSDLQDCPTTGGGDIESSPCIERQSAEVRPELSLNLRDRVAPGQRDIIDYGCQLPLRGDFPDGPVLCVVYRSIRSRRHTVHPAECCASRVRGESLHDLGGSVRRQAKELQCIPIGTPRVV